MFDIEPLTGKLGAQLWNLDLAEGWDTSLVAKLSDTLRDYKVLVLRDQSSLTPQQLVDFSRTFGVPETRMHPLHGDFPSLPELKILRTDGTDAINRMGGRVSLDEYGGWHTDGSVRADTHNWISLLYAEQVPSYGRDTIFADMEAVYNRLSPAFQALVDDLWATHAFPGSSTIDGFEPTTHPVVLADPLTERRCIYVNQMYTGGIVGMRQDESDAILNLLFERVHRPEVQLRVAWKRGSLVIWDNVRTQHSHITDREGLRIMYRVMVARDMP